MSDQQEPRAWAWDDDRIFGRLKELGAYGDYKDGIEVIPVTVAEMLGFEMRDEYEATIAALTAQLAAERDASRITDSNLTGDLEMAQDKIATLTAQLAAAQKDLSISDALYHGTVDTIAMLELEAQVAVEPKCAICQTKLEWRTCWECDGTGDFDAGSLDMHHCHVCKSEGGWWQCPLHHNYDGTQGVPDK